MYLILIPKIALLMFLNPIIHVMVRMLAYSALDTLSGQIIKFVLAVSFLSTQD